MSQHPSSLIFKALLQRVLPPSIRTTTSVVVLIIIMSTAGGIFHSSSLQAVVADVGSYSTKMGWAGQDSPPSYFRSVRLQRRDSHYYFYYSPPPQPHTPIMIYFHLTVSFSLVVEQTTYRLWQFCVKNPLPPRPNDIAHAFNKCNTIFRM